ncbi:MAG: ribosome silencing factor [Pseudomonadota bacterium]|jgi:ribosome-associated protein|nr:ribosome silencing factor [Alphaproteobacteria bacterium]MDP5012895.1 ribosome silencing factor [Alphaproteobacteria bacterium]MDP5370441.1 ribosome silencing factor [Pseudomonadota bacterium]
MNTHEIVDLVKTLLDDKKAEHVTVIDLNGQGAIVDYMIIASGTSNRHVSALAGFIASEFKLRGIQTETEGTPLCDWVLLDIGDVLVHLFRPDVREFYNLEKMWGDKSPRPSSAKPSDLAALSASHAATSTTEQ